MTPFWFPKSFNFVFGGVLGVILAVLAALEVFLERLRLVLGRLEGILDRLGGILGPLGDLRVCTGVHGRARGWARRGLLLEFPGHHKEHYKEHKE